jgi:hypothetical protein
VNASGRHRRPPEKEARHDHHRLFPHHRRHRRGPGRRRHPGPAAAGAAAARGAGAATAAHLDTHNLADYGAAITADNATDTARSAGVPHMSDNHKGSGSYFEQMNGGAN